MTLYSSPHQNSTPIFSLNKFSSLAAGVDERPARRVIPVIMRFMPPCPKAICGETRVIARS